jgi:hypothetical protein
MTLNLYVGYCNRRRPGDTQHWILILAKPGEPKRTWYHVKGGPAGDPPADTCKVWIEDGKRFNSNGIESKSPLIATISEADRNKVKAAVQSVEFNAARPLRLRFWVNWKPRVLFRQVPEPISRQGWKQSSQPEANRWISPRAVKHLAPRRPALSHRAAGRPGQDPLGWAPRKPAHPVLSPAERFKASWRISGPLSSSMYRQSLRMLNVV